MKQNKERPSFFKKAEGNKRPTEEHWCEYRNISLLCLMSKTFGISLLQFWAIEFWPDCNTTVPVLRSNINRNLSVIADFLQEVQCSPIFCVLGNYGYGLGQAIIMLTEVTQGCMYINTCCGAKEADLHKKTFRAGIHITQTQGVLFRLTLGWCCELKGCRR